jgi:hypothetical protein
MGRNIWVVREVKTFWEVGGFVRSGGAEGSVGRKDPLAGNIRISSNFI